MFISTALRRLLSNIALILLAGFITFLGRLAIDKLMVVAPQWSSEIERFGGSAIGMVVVAASVIPMLKLNGIIQTQREQ